MLKEKRRENKKSSSKLAYALLAIPVVIVVFVLGALAGGYFIFNIVPSAPASLPVAVGDGKTIEMTIPAVDTEGNGVTGKLITIVRPASIAGSGQVLVSVNNVVSQYDTQLSARTAVKAAERLTGIKASDYDVIYVMQVDAEAIEGPSAGASMAVAAAAALENRDIDNTVAITGTIREDGAIGPVGGVEQKLEASKRAGIQTFLVARGQSADSKAERTQVCEKRGEYQYCRIEYVVAKTDSTGGLTQVSTLQEAMEYFVK